MCLKSAQMSITWTNNIFSSSTIGCWCMCKNPSNREEKKHNKPHMYTMHTSARALAYASHLLTDNNATISKCKSHLGPFNLKTNQLINHSKWKRFIIYLFVWYLFFHIKQCTLLSNIPSRFITFHVITALNLCSCSARNIIQSHLLTHFISVVD